MNATPHQLMVKERLFGLTSEEQRVLNDFRIMELAYLCAVIFYVCEEIRGEKHKSTLAAIGRAYGRSQAAVSAKKKRVISVMRDQK